MLQTDIKRSSRGFSIVELAIVIALVSILAGFFVVVINAGIKSSLYQDKQAALMTDSYSALKRMTREIRATRNNASITIFTTSEYSFIDVGGNAIDYKQSGTNLLRNTDVLLTDVTSPGGISFTYLNDTGVATSVASTIRLVNIVLAVSSGSNKVKLQSAGRVRNR